MHHQLETLLNEKEGRFEGYLQVSLMLLLRLSNIYKMPPKGQSTLKSTLHYREGISFLRLKSQVIE